jgi:low molecular weight protein-tyrosine phosphatase
MTGGPGARPVTVLAVCTGNICRSPAAEFLLRAGLGDDAGIEVTSAGISALAGEPVADPMARLLRARGVDPTGFVARQLDPVAVRGADLVLTMTAEQRSAVVGRAPAAVRRTFTLGEFADLSRLVDVTEVRARHSADRLAELVAAAPRARSRRGSRQDDVEDPYGRPEEVFRRVLAQIEAAVDSLLGVLTPVAHHVQ